MEEGMGGLERLYNEMLMRKNRYAEHERLFQEEH